VFKKNIEGTQIGEIREIREIREISKIILISPICVQKIKALN
jgi:hypothetical protein